jgi:hypothetical protein
LADFTNNGKPCHSPTARRNLGLIFFPGVLTGKMIGVIFYKIPGRHLALVADKKGTLPEARSSSACSRRDSFWYAMRFMFDLDIFWRSCDLRALYLFIQPRPTFDRPLHDGKLKAGGEFMMACPTATIWNGASNISKGPLTSTASTASSFMKTCPADRQAPE